MDIKPLEVRQLVKNYESLRAVDHVSFEIRPGEIFGLLGPNGAGKTTIISNIVSLDTPTSGEVLVFGKNVQARKRECAIQVGFVPQEAVNHGYFDVEEILEFQSGYYGRLKNTERIHYLLQRLDLWEHRKKRIRQLSGGMKRRLLIAKALVHEPQLLLLDEPTAGVDVELRESLWEFIEELRSQGMSILLTTHYLEEAESLCQRVGILNRGRLLKVGETKELVESLTHRDVSIKVRGEGVDLDHPLLVEKCIGGYNFKIPATKSIGDLLQETKINLADIVDIKIVEGSLEEAFKNVLGGE